MLRVSQTSKNIIISGAGLIGSALAIALKQKGYEVSIYEKRSDMRKNTLDAGRSINLIITAKGLNTFQELGIIDDVLEITTPVVGRMMHSTDAELTFQPYGRDDSEHNLSVNRSELNKKLMTIAESKGVHLFFEEELQNINFVDSWATFTTKEKEPFDIFFGADGVSSQTRKQMAKVMNMQDEIIPLGVHYKELSMPARDGDYPMRKDCLHIWPRGSHMLMALANLDGSFTMTLYMPEEDFAKITNQDELNSYFREFYPDSIELMPNYQQEFFENKTSYLGTLKCSPWIYQDKVCLIGDAAHAIVPFFGQGMNCGLSDVHYLLKSLERNEQDWGKALEDYHAFQKKNSDAIAELSIENCKIMSQSVGDENFLFQKKVEHKIENIFPTDYRSRYGMITYTLIPYHLAKEAGEIQKDILNTLCTGKKSVDEVDMAEAESLIKNKLIPFYKEHNMDINRWRQN